MSQDLRFGLDLLVNSAGVTDRIAGLFFQVPSVTVRWYLDWRQRVLAKFF